MSVRVTAYREAPPMPLLLLLLTHAACAGHDDWADPLLLGRPTMPPTPRRTPR